MKTCTFAIVLSLLFVAQGAEANTKKKTFVTCVEDLSPVDGPKTQLTLEQVEENTFLARVKKTSNNFGEVKVTARNLGKFTCDVRINVLESMPVQYRFGYANCQSQGRSAILKDLSIRYEDGVRVAEITTHIPNATLPRIERIAGKALECDISWK